MPFTWLCSSFQLEQVSSSQHTCVVPFLGACLSLLDGEEPSLLKQHFVLVGVNVFSSCPQVGTGAHTQRETFFPNSWSFLFLFIHKQVSFDFKLEIEAFSSNWFAF